MPTLIDEIISIPYQSRISIRLEPAFAAIQALLLMTKMEHSQDLDEWITQTALAMPPEERRRNELVAMGLYYAVIPDRSWPNFQAYLQHIKEMPAQSLVNRMLDAYQAHVCSVTQGQQQPDPGSVYDAIRSLDTYLGFLRAKFDMFDEQIETQAFHYVHHPEEMKALILTHLSEMWEKYLSPEWQTVKPDLQAVVNAYAGVDFRDMSPLTALKWVTGREVNEVRWAQQLEEARQIIFVPSAHAGPFLGKYLSSNGTLRILYQARLPRQMDGSGVELSRAEILIRLNTLADDVRLRMLHYISEHGETRSQTLIDELNLSQSAASRHLSVLSGMGYLTERRCSGAKCYTVNPDRIEETLQAIETYLLGKDGGRKMTGQLERSLE